MYVEEPAHMENSFSSMIFSLVFGFSTFYIYFRSIKVFEFAASLWTGFSSRASRTPPIMLLPHRCCKVLLNQSLKETDEGSVKT